MRCHPEYPRIAARHKRRTRGQVGDKMCKTKVRSGFGFRMCWGERAIAGIGTLHRRNAFPRSDEYKSLLLLARSSQTVRENLLDSGTTNRPAFLWRPPSR